MRFVCNIVSIYIYCLFRTPPNPRGLQREIRNKQKPFACEWMNLIKRRLVGNELWKKNGLEAAIAVHWLQHVKVERVELIKPSAHIITVRELETFHQNVTIQQSFIIPLFSIRVFEHVWILTERHRKMSALIRKNALFRFVLYIKITANVYIFPKQYAGNCISLCLTVSHPKLAYHHIGFST